MSSLYLLYKAFIKGNPINLIELNDKPHANKTANGEMKRLLRRSLLCGLL